jgi:hypothetical protein
MSNGQSPVCLSLFTDEFGFHVDFADECARVWIGRIERFYPENVIQRDHYRDGNVMIWGKIGYYGKTNLIKVNGTQYS